MSPYPLAFYHSSMFNSSLLILICVDSRTNNEFNEQLMPRCSDILLRLDLGMVGHDEDNEPTKHDTMQHEKIGSCRNNTSHFSTLPFFVQVFLPLKILRQVFYDNLQFQHRINLFLHAYCLAKIVEFYCWLTTQFYHSITINQTCLQETSCVVVRVLHLLVLGQVKANFLQKKICTTYFPRFISSTTNTSKDNLRFCEEKWDTSPSKKGIRDLGI